MRGNRSRVTGKNEWGPAAPAGFHLDGVDGLPDFGDADVGRHVGGDSRVRLHKRIKTLTGFRAFLSHAPGKMLMADTESSHAEMLPLEPPEVPAGHPR